MSLQPCARCATPVLPAMTSCPHCHTALTEGEGVRGLPVLLAGLLLTGCGDKEDTGDTGPLIQPDYGIAYSDDSYTDDDGDGYAELDGDCNDDDDTIHPNATETPGDGIDSNCDGEDDT